MGSLRERSFGIVMLLLAAAGMPPGLTTVAGLLLMIPACQMIAGLPAPSFPRRIAARPLPIRHLAALVQRAVPVLRNLETMFHPRWPTPIRGTKRLVSLALLFLDATVLLIPIPMVRVVPDLVIALISRAYPEEDGLLLSIAGSRPFSTFHPESGHSRSSARTWQGCIALNQNQPWVGVLSCYWLPRRKAGHKVAARGAAIIGAIVLLALYHIFFRRRMLLAR